MSDTNLTHDRTVLALDADIGGDGDNPGISQTLTLAEIDDVLSNTAMTIEEKRARLEQFAGQMGDREAIDRGSEFEPLELQIRDALSMLADGGHAYGSAESVGMDPDYRSDARAPDDLDSVDDPELR